ncbi:hypothetical protein [Candidatus Poriferisocius sp.]|uniref:hypothetical protein n=1 Tax=Candidatus Poriferisocius sp. TaxID=3101276 RepID=UPI003B02756D
MSELAEDASSEMSKRSFLVVCQTARFSAVWILLGVVFPWVRVSGTTSYIADSGLEVGVSSRTVEGYETADGIWVFILGFAVIVAVAVYKSSERLWALVLAAMSSLAILATAIIDMASLHRLAGDWPEPREASVHFGLYIVLIASLFLAVSIAVLVWEYARQDKAGR